MKYRKKKTQKIWFTTESIPIIIQLNLKLKRGDKNGDIKKDKRKIFRRV